MELRGRPVAFGFDTDAAWPHIEMWSLDSMNYDWLVAVMPHAEQASVSSFATPLV